MKITKLDNLNSNLYVDRINMIYSFAQHNHAMGNCKIDIWIYEIIGGLITHEVYKQTQLGYANLQTR